MSRSAWYRITSLSRCVLIGATLASASSTGIGVAL